MARCPPAAQTSRRRVRSARVGAESVEGKYAVRSPSSPVPRPELHSLPHTPRTRNLSSAASTMERKAALICCGVRNKGAGCAACEGTHCGGAAAPCACARAGGRARQPGRPLWAQTHRRHLQSLLRAESPASASFAEAPQKTGLPGAPSLCVDLAAGAEPHAPKTIAPLQEFCCVSGTDRGPNRPLICNRSC